MKKRKFETQVFEGHKGLIAIHLPFDPAAAWGKQARYFVKGTVGKCRFEGEAGFRRGFHYTLLEEGLLKAAGLSPGTIALFTLEPRKPTEAEKAEKPKLAWVKLVKKGRP